MAAGRDQAWGEAMSAAGLEDGGKGQRPLLGRAAARAGGLLDRHTVGMLAVLFVVGALGLLWHQGRQQQRLIESAVEQDARRTNEALAEARSLYTSEVV